jgi:pSer/pThr/pTyr-binding forkhead associated (FHA) protein
MILCPNCHHQELPGALFCSECGAQLVAADAMTTQNFSQTHPETYTSTFGDIAADIPQVETDQKEDQEAFVSLRFVDTDKIIHLSGRPEYSLGRTAEGQPILPDIDLSEYEAYSQGVSRLHASVKINLQRISIMDLGSSNGTRVNGQKIVPHVDYPIKHGDVIALGKLRFQLIVHK